MKFRAVVQYEVEINADNEEVAKELISDNPPFIDICGGGINWGSYDMKSKNGVKLIEIVEEKDNKKK